MTTLGIGIWLVSAVFAYYFVEVAVFCCDPTQWNHINKIVVGIWAWVLGPFAMVIAFEILLLAEMAEGCQDLTAPNKPLPCEQASPILTR